MIESLTIPATLPRHVAIIMDGNRRWARGHGLPILIGYRRGVRTLRETVRVCHELGMQVLTVYAFSEENWNRSPAEVALLMRLCSIAARNELNGLMRENVRVRISGRYDLLPPRARTALHELVERTAANTGLTLNLAINYGARTEIVDAMRQLASEVESGARTAASIDDKAVRDRLYNADLPDPDLVIRTGGELRMSNFLLFQAAYAEFWSTAKHWPEFAERDLLEALHDFSNRQRRFGT